jgi:cytochrome c peroxidase
VSRRRRNGGSRWALPAAALAAAAASLLAAAAGGAAAGAAGATDDPAASFSPAARARLLRMSPLPPPPPDPSNAVADDPRAVRLGRRLFFDPRLSIDGHRSCATCHDPARHWTDGRPASTPAARFPRNAPSLWNTAYNRWYGWDGRADSAWAQALGPLEAEGELGSNRLRLFHQVRSDPALLAAYAELFGPLPEGADDPRRFPADARPLPRSPDDALQRAWAAMREEDREQANRVFANLGKAIAAFERRLVVRETVLDRFVAATRAGTAPPVDGLSAAAVRGLRLFVGRGGCTLCHSGPLLSDGEFHDVGIALTRGHRVDPARHRGVFELLQSPFTRLGPYADVPDPAAPVRFLEPATHQLGQFKTPSLRGVADTAPYMHDGRFATLEEVVRFYDGREGAAPLGHPTSLLQPLGLDEGEVADLVAFLGSLTHQRDRPLPVVE